MKTLSGLAIAVIVVSLPVSAHAVDVSFEKTHLCCGKCVKAVEKSLKKAVGVFDAKCDREKKTVTFKATDRKAAIRGIRALMDAGFFGTAKVDGTAVKLREPNRKAEHFSGTVRVDGVVIKPVRSNVKAAKKVAKATFHGPHLCCGKCEKAVRSAVKTVDGVTTVAVDRKKRTVSVAGTNIDVAAVISALHKAGFSARYGTRQKRNAKSVFRD